MRICGVVELRIYQILVLIRGSTTMCPVSLKVYLRRSIESYIYCGVIIGGACIYPGLLGGAYGAALVFY